MFECGVRGDSDLAVEAHGSQQNGAILGNGCAIFLCKFMARLKQEYESACAEQDIDIEGPINQDVYKEVLSTVLKSCAKEDATEHGRLLALKPILGSLCDEKRLSDEQLALIYMKDVCVLRGLDVQDDGVVEELEANPPTEEEIEQIIS